MECIYDIELVVPLGVRKGIIFCAQKENVVTGIMEVLGRMTEFTGTVLGEKIEIEGILRGYNRQIDYKGVGEMGKDFLHMKLMSEKDIYELTGHLRR